MSCISYTRIFLDSYNMFYIYFSNILMVTGENSFLVEDVMKIILIIDKDITLSVRTEKKQCICLLLLYILSSHAPWIK